MSSRIINSIRNTSYGIFSQIIGSILMFVTRTVFIYSLGNTYLGLSGLFADILTLLSLAELGVGTAIIYSMYKPLADNNQKKVSALVTVYGKIYIYIGIFVTILGLCLIPFLSFFVSGIPNIPNLNLIYILYLFNTSLSYFFIYKKSILIASENAYIISIVQTAVTLLQNLMQICVLLIFNNFIIYLLIQILCVLINNICISIYVDKKFTYLKKYRNEKVDKDTQKEITKNVVAMFLSKVSSAVVTSTDSILISKFVSTVILGYYSNYILFINLIRQIFTKIFEAITGSVGNLVASENKYKLHRTFENILFVNFWLIGFCSIILFIMINPFIKIWLGESYMLNITIVFFICLNLYMRFIRNTALVFIDSYGLFWNIKWKCIAEAIINLISSIIYLKVFKLGITGVLLGTFTSNILTNFWYEPYVIYRYKFNEKIGSYYIKFFKYFIVTLVAACISYLLTNITFTNNVIIEFIIDFIISSIIVNIIFIISFYKTNEFIYFKNIMYKKLKKNKF